MTEAEILTRIVGWAVGSEIDEENATIITLLNNLGFLRLRVHHSKDDKLGTWISRALTKKGFARLRRISPDGYKLARKAHEFYERTGSLHAPTDTRSALQIRRDVIAREAAPAEIGVGLAYRAYADLPLIKAERDRLKADKAELLAALEDLFALAETDESGRIYGATLDKARAAIAKAKE